MQFGVQVNVYRTGWDAVRASVDAMEAGPWDSLWFADHFIPPGADQEQEALTAFEGLTGIAMAAGMTRKLRLGNLVLGNTYRNPAHVAKIAGTIDTMSGGRFTLAIGAGWYERPPSRLSRPVLSVGSGAAITGQPRRADPDYGRWHR